MQGWMNMIDTIQKVGMIIMLIGFTVAVVGFVLVLGSLVWEEIK